MSSTRTRLFGNWCIATLNLKTAIILFLAGTWLPTPVASRAHMSWRRQPRQQGQNN